MSSPKPTPTQDVVTSSQTQAVTSQLNSQNGIVVPSNYGGIQDSTDVATEIENKEKLTDVRSDPRRFYILLVFSLCCFSQGMVWNTWGPLADSAKTAFGWTDSTVALQSNWGPIAFVVGIMPSTWLMDKKGVRWSTLSTIGLVTVGTALRCITSNPPSSTWLIHTGQFLNGLAGPVAMGGPPLISAVWFPVHERTTATAFAMMVSGFGIAVSFITGPLLVPTHTPRNETHVHNISSNHSLDNSTGIHETRQAIMRLMYIEFGWAAFLFLVVLIYFPAKPKIAPSITAKVERMDYFQAIKELVKHTKFWMLSIPYALSTGTYGVWGSVLFPIISSSGLSQVTQNDAGWIGFWGTVAGSVAGLGFGFCADVFSRRMKLFIVTLYTSSVAMFIVFSLVCQQIIPYQLWLLYLTFILGTIFMYGGVPLMYELVCESAYPISEGVTNGFMTCLNNVAGLFFLLIPMFAQFGVWTNWLMVGCSAACVPIFALYKENYRRLDIDETVDKSDNTEDNPRI